ncbi:MAG: hypothetical protein IPP69_02810 [Flavobacteriales bacterium]|nr:hypothetical protein [Flavobacteriales bacterium]
MQYLDFVGQTLKFSDITELFQLFANQELGELKDNSVSEFIHKFKSICIAKNQFYTVYDIRNGVFVEVDPKVNSALGIVENDFNLAAMVGLDPNNHLFHPEDINHMIRWASLAYFIFDFPFFQWETAEIYYSVTFRIGTERSTMEKLRKASYVALEKRCYPLVSVDSNGAKKPVCHVDQWSVLDASNCQYVKPKWVISGDHSEMINDLFYLFNAYLLNFPMKYLLMLNEKMSHDRNKAVAHSINEKLLNLAGIETDFDEIQIGNALTKTARQKVENTYNQWDKRMRGNTVTVLSDQDAVHYAKALGLLPIPPEIVNRIYKLLCN